MSNTIANENSILLDLNSRQADQDPVYGNGRFVVTVPNASKITECVKVVPTKVTIPNIFPNVRSGTNLRIYRNADPATQVTENTILIPEGFYSRDELIQLVSGDESIVRLSYDETTKRFTLTWTFSYTFTVGTPIGAYEFFFDSSDTHFLSILGYPCFNNRPCIGSFSLDPTQDKPSATSVFQYLDINKSLVSFTMPEGSYEMADFVSQINSNFQGINPINPVVMSYDSVTKKISFSCTEQFYVVNQADGNDFADRLGILTSTDVNSLGVLTYTGEAAVSFDRYISTAANPPNLGGEKIVNVALSPITDSNLVTSNGLNFAILTSVSLADTTYGDYAIQAANDRFTEDADFPRSLSAQRVTISLLDSNYEQLFVPTNYHVTVQLKIYHVNTSYAIKQR